MSATSSPRKPSPVPNARHVVAPSAISERDDKRVEQGGELGTGGRQEQRARQKEEVENSSFTIHSNRPDVRMMNGAFYPISNATKWGSGCMASTR